jgi:hypothetical protein
MKAVRSNLQPVADSHDVRWLEVTVHEALPMKIGERIEDCVEHLSGLGGREWPLGKNLRENFVGILRHGVEQRDGVNLAAPGVKHAHQVRMRQGCRQRPAVDAGFRVGVSRNELDGGLLRFTLREFREKDAAPSGPAHPLQEGESPVDDPPYPIPANCGYVHRVTILL